MSVKQIGARIKEELFRRGQTPADLVRMTGLGRATIDRFIDGGGAARPVTLKVIADALGWQFDFRRNQIIPNDGGKAPMTDDHQINELKRQISDLQNKLDVEHRHTKTELDKAERRIDDLSRRIDECNGRIRALESKTR